MNWQNWIHLIKYIFTLKTLNGKILGDVLDIGWIYQQAKFDLLIPKHSAAIWLLTAK